MNELPEVGGDRLEMTLADFERGCLLELRDEQEKPNLNNHLVNLLCEAVRLKREHVTMLKNSFVGYADYISLRTEVEQAIDALDGNDDLPDPPVTELHRKLAEVLQAFKQTCDENERQQAEIKKLRLLLDLVALKGSGK